MINRENPRQLSIEEFELPFGGELDKRNRWVKLAEEMPWEELSVVYNKALSVSEGRPALSARVVVGALIIKHMLGLTDEETVAQIRENPYLQYFLGYACYRYDHKFEPSLFVAIRKRLGEESIGAINELFVACTKRWPGGKKKAGSAGGASSGESPGEDQGTAECGNQGMLLVDATVAPSDIKYPTDIDLLNQVRKECERLIDVVYEPMPDKVKPRTYRRKARKAYLAVTKKRNKSAKVVRRAIKEQLGFIGRDFRILDALIGEKGDSFPLSFKDQRRLWVIREVYRQQEEMYRTNSHHIEGRIVSIAQPHVRPIVRGKAGAKVEFGPKLSASVIEGTVFLDRIGWDAYNESGDLIAQVERFRNRFGCYPEVVVNDKIYGSKDNRNELKLRGIRFSGVPLGRPPKDLVLCKKLKQQRRKEAGIRNGIEGKFGVGKRKFGLGLVMTKLRETSESWVAMVIFVLNIAHWLRDIFVPFVTPAQNTLYSLIFILFRKKLQSLGRTLFPPTVSF
jgi:transposase, IS5 family